jgi:asparagine synthase (glutamine-hydrolysing)
MCAIFGVLDPVGVNLSMVQGMSEMLRHRGPDDEGFILCTAHDVLAVGGSDTPATVYDMESPYRPAENIGATSKVVPLVLGHRRLAIHDLSPAGHQPMSAAGRYWIIFNGEVYNFIELRTELIALGYRFMTNTDTEVILCAYIEWGERCLTRFNGMWALAIYDQQQRVLFLARDRFGVKPLYFSFEGGRFSFASEIKAVLQASGTRARAQMDRLMDFLVWNISDHTNQTMFHGIVQLPPGHFARISVGATIDGLRALVPGDIEQVRWYTLQSRQVDAGSAVEMFRETLQSAVDLRLRADVPVGSCLSGGLDSSSIVCLMKDGLGDDSAGFQKTFTARSDDPAYDESRYAKAVIDKTGVDPHYVTPLPERLFDDLDRIIWHQDEPFVSTSIFAQWCVFSAAREAGVVVMLDGQGADEILGGYRGFFGAYLASLMSRGSIFRWTQEILAMRKEIGFGFARSVGYMLAYLRPQYAHILGRFDSRAYGDRDWIDSSQASVFLRNPAAQGSGGLCSVRDMSITQVTRTNLPMLLHWEDRNSMAFSVEARVPFLDYRVVETALGLPDESKVGSGISKRILRQAMRGIVPDLVLDRRDKMGFVTAEELWVTRDMAARFRKELVSAVATLARVIDPKVVVQFDEVLAGKRKFDHRYWRTIVAARWVLAFDVEIPGCSV